MDSSFYEHIKNQALEQFPPLVNVLGAHQAEVELMNSLMEHSHMLLPEEVHEIASFVIGECLGGIS